MKKGRLEMSKKNAVSFLHPSLSYYVQRVRHPLWLCTPLCPIHAVGHFAMLYIERSNQW